MFKRNNLQQLIEYFKKDPDFNKQIVHWHTIDEKPAQLVDLPLEIDERIKEALHKRGMEKLYTHQSSAFHLAMEGKSFTAVTPTASGKTLCYNLPVLQTILDQPDSRALYIFPTKALAQDQKSELNEIIAEAEVSINSYDYS